MKIKVSGKENNVVVTDEHGKEIDNIKSVVIKYNVAKNSAQATIVVVDPLLDVETGISTKVVKKQ